MRNAILIFCAVVAAVVGAYFLIPPASEKLISSDAPDVSMTTLDGKSIQLQNFRGYRIYVHFWASWCTPCLTELPQLLTFARAHSNDVFMLVTADERPVDAQKFLEKFARRFPATAHLKNVYFIRDQDKAISSGIFFTYRYPETVVIDKTFHLADKFPGPHDWSEK